VTDWTLLDLTRTAPDHPNQPHEIAFRAMEFLISNAFRRASKHYRERRLHARQPCWEGCDMCPAIIDRHVVYATVKLHKHLRDGAPFTRGVEVRDWVTILTAATAPAARLTALADIRRGFSTVLAEDDPNLKLVFAFSTQFGLQARETPSNGRGAGQRSARGPRLTRDIVNDHLAGVLAAQQGWAAKPRRDLVQRADLKRVVARFPAGAVLLDDILRHLDYGEPDGFETVIQADGVSSDDIRELRGLVEALLRPPTGEWFQANVVGRQNYNEDVARQVRDRARRNPDDTSVA
jgi:hypothetical protein